MRLIVPPEQFALPAGICWGFAHLLADGTVQVTLNPAPATAAAGAEAQAHLDAIRREVERRAQQALAAEKGQA